MQTPPTAPIFRAYKLNLSPPPTLFYACKFIKTPYKVTLGLTKKYPQNVENGTTLGVNVGSVPPLGVLAICAVSTSGDNFLYTANASV